MSGAGYRAAKRAFDVTASALGLVLTSPLWLAAVVGIEVSDPGPVFYLAKRVGQEDRVFRMYKFRSMRVDKHANEKSFKADVNRIFPWGAFMRSSKIDELPQLLIDGFTGAPVSYGLPIDMYGFRHGSSPLSEKIWAVL